MDTAWKLVLAILPALYHRSVFSLMTSCIPEIVTDRRRSSGFSRGASIYRGVTRFVCGRICRHILLPCSTKVHIETTPVCSCWLHYRHHQHGRWQSRIGRVAGNKDLYLGTFSKRDLYMTVGFVFWIDKYVVSRVFWRKGTCRPASCLLLRTNVGFEIYSSEKSMHSRLEKGVLKWTWDSM